MNELAEHLKQLNKMVRNDRNLTVKALGILLLGKKFEDTIHRQEPVDPTELILHRQGPTIPEF